MRAGARGGSQVEFESRRLRIEDDNSEAKRWRGKLCGGEGRFATTRKIHGAGFVVCKREKRRGDDQSSRDRVGISPRGEGVGAKGRGSEKPGTRGHGQTKHSNGAHQFKQYNSDSEESGGPLWWFWLHGDWLTGGRNADRPSNPPPGRLISLPGALSETGAEGEIRADLGTSSDALVSLSPRHEIAHSFLTSSPYTHIQSFISYQG